MKLSTRKSLWLLFLLSPLISTILAFKYNRNKFAKNILWAFIVFYGFTFTISEESIGSDINSYISELKILHGKTFTFSEAIDYFEESGEIDILRTLLSISISRFTESPIVLTTVFAFIFGFFYSRNLFFIIENLQGKWNQGVFLLVIVFSLIIPIWNINGFRMWTAAHLFIYGLLPYLFFGKKQRLWFCVFCPLVHFSFVLPVIILFIYILAGSKIHVYFILFILSMIFSELNLSWFNENFEKYLPQAFIDRTVGYRTEGTVISYREDIGTGFKWYALWYGKALGYAIKAFIILFYFKHRTVIKSNQFLRAFAFALLFYSFANLLNSLPSGGRLISIANLVSLSVIIFFAQHIGLKGFSRYFFYFTIPAFLLFVIISIRIGLYSVSVTTIFGNPIIAIITMGNNIALNDLIK